MRDSVRRMFLRFSEDLEGRTNWLYLDNKGLMTTGVGNLVDSLPAVLGLPWRRPDGSWAPREEVIAAYLAVRARTDWTARGGGAFASLTTIRLAPEDVDHLVERKLAQNEYTLLRRWPEMPAWPADAELAAHSWAWAVGAGAPYPLLTEALRHQDFDAAAEQIRVTDGLGGEPGTLRERNRRNVVLLRNASRVQGAHLDPDVVYWPTDLRGVIQAAETVPDVSRLDELDDPATEPDGGAARHDATSDAVEQAARDDVDRRNDGD